MNRINPNFLNHEFYGGKVGVGLVQIPDGIRSSETTKLFFLEDRKQRELFHHNAGFYAQNWHRVWVELETYIA